MKIDISFIHGPVCEISEYDNSEHEFRIEFINKNTNRLESIQTIKTDHWASASIEYQVDWRIRVTGVNHHFYYEYDFDCTGKRVFIDIDSDSLGDMLAWLPYVEQFRQERNCTVICSVYQKSLFTDQYPEIKFVDPEIPVYDLYAQYTLGVYVGPDGNAWDPFKNPANPFQQPLQKVASDILGLRFKETRPKLPLSKTPRNKKRQVCIAIHTTRQAKYWNNPDGWQEVVDYLKQAGYQVILLSKEKDGHMGNHTPSGIKRHPSGSLQNVIRVLEESMFFIGISSGLSWLSWSVGVPSIIISGFTDSYVEPLEDTYRIINREVCHSCWDRHTFIKDDWYWCPDYQGTERQYECSKAITSADVIREIERLEMLHFPPQ